MLKSIRAFADLHFDLLRGKAGERLTGVVLALLAELILVLVLLSLVRSVGW